MKKIIQLITFFVGISVGTFAQNWKPVTAGISFKIKMMGATVDGKFKGFVGIVKFDPADLATASVSGTVDATTIDTDSNLRNRHLKEKEEFFDVAKYPTLKMKSTKIEKDGANFVGTFDLTMKATTKSVKIPFTFKQDGDKATFAGSTVINRKDWSVGGGTWGMGSDVTFSVTINTVKTN